MKQYILFIFLITNLKISACPCEFSPHDQRPFFEQYEIETNTQTTQEKEKK